eukprot:gnl/Chilomastix_cuspidata/3838.p1 GENE.gnl/Chilomastix_cuspidata/3838~~gnl/Chilomastix_cuspidata/3838.p1  ORF type:complete len:150 (+),score=7.36 gnl/Chilomastix_cuspidata/3838:354-803(+)
MIAPERPVRSKSRTRGMAPKRIRSRKNSKTKIQAKSYKHPSTLRFPTLKNQQEGHKSLPSKKSSASRQDRSQQWLSPVYAVFPFAPPEQFSFPTVFPPPPTAAGRYISRMRELQAAERQKARVKAPKGRGRRPNARRRRSHPRPASERR